MCWEGLTLEATVLNDAALLQVENERMKKSILLVDDEKAFVLSLSEGLRFLDKKFNVLTAENGEQAVEILKSVHVDVLITDLKMPVMDGFELLIEVLKHYPNMPVIVVTAFSNPDVIRKLNAIGFYHCIEKPLEFEDLVEKILYMLNYELPNTEGTYPTN